MPSKALLLFAEWRAANKAATEAEIAQFDATLVYLRGSGPKPAETQLQRTNELRAHAAELFRLAMAQFDTEDQTQTAQPRSDPPTRRPAGLAQRT